ncbi:hypothetical protein N7453_011925 [Penicillium expansum]|nr:hypothetical protein N7453_011925 [Penicillium expansum]
MNGVVLIFSPEAPLQVAETGRHVLSSATPQSSCPSPFGHAQGLSSWRTVTTALRLVAVTDWSWIASWVPSGVHAHF